MFPQLKFRQAQTSQIRGLTPAKRLQTSKVSGLSGLSDSDNFRWIRHLVTFLMWGSWGSEACQGAGDIEI